MEEERQPHQASACPTQAPPQIQTLPAKTGHQPCIAPLHYTLHTTHTAELPHAVCRRKAAADSVSHSRNHVEYAVTHNSSQAATIVSSKYPGRLTQCKYLSICLLKLALSCYASVHAQNCTAQNWQCQAGTMQLLPWDLTHSSSMHVPAD